MPDIYLHDSASAKCPKDESHGQHITDPNFKGLPDFGPKIVIGLRVIEYINSRSSHEEPVDDANHSELDRRIPVKEDVLEEKPDQVDDQQDHLLELSILFH